MGLVQSPGGSLLLSSGSWCMQSIFFFFGVPSRSGVSVFPSLVEVHLVTAFLSSLDVGYVFFFFFGGFCILLLMFVQQMAVIWMLFQEKMSTCSSTPSF